MNFIRRNFVRSLVALGNLGLFRRAAHSAPAQDTDPQQAPVRPKLFLTVAQLATLEAICDQIIPPDEDPGGTQAGVPHFIDNALATWASEYRRDYTLGLEAIDESSRLMFDSAFNVLPSKQQIELLTAMENGTAPGSLWGPSGARARKDKQFFELVLKHSMQGYYADPKYGGNRNRASWKMIGYLGMTHR